MNVIKTIAKNGISSAKNLHKTALLIFGMGINEAKIAHPIKKIIDFNDTTINFFIVYKPLILSNAQRVLYSTLSNL